MTKNKQQWWRWVIYKTKNGWPTQKQYTGLKTTNVMIEDKSNVMTEAI